MTEFNKSLEIMIKNVRNLQHENQFQLYLKTFTELLRILNLIIRKQPSLISHCQDSMYFEMMNQLTRATIIF